MRKFTLFSAIALFACTGAQAQNAGSLDVVMTDQKSDAPVLTLTVSGMAAAKPDRAAISAGVQTKAVSATNAMAENARQMAAVLSALKSGGVADRDIQTSSVSLGQDYEYSEKGQIFKGYIANNSVTVRLKDITKIGNVLDVLVKSGATNVNGPSFMMADDSALSEEARTKAMAKAASLSAFYAKSAGYARARLLSIAEANDYNSPVPMMNMRAMDASAAGGGVPPVEAGEVNKIVNITVKYRLER
jgi:uncharacterized protein YggE